MGRTSWREKRSYNRFEIYSLLYLVKLLNKNFKKYVSGNWTGDHSSIQFFFNDILRAHYFFCQFAFQLKIIIGNAFLLIFILFPAILLKNWLFKQKKCENIVYHRLQVLIALAISKKLWTCPIMTQHYDSIFIVTMYVRQSFFSVKQTKIISKQEKIKK